MIRSTVGPLDLFGPAIFLLPVGVGRGEVENVSCYDK